MTPDPLVSNGFNFSGAGLVSYDGEGRQSSFTSTRCQDIARTDLSGNISPTRDGEGRLKTQRRACNDHSFEMSGSLPASISFFRAAVEELDLPKANQRG